MIIKGKDLRITPASFDDAMNLQKAIGKAINQNRIGIDLNNIEDADSILNLDFSKEMLGDFLRTAISIGISNDVEQCIFKCAERALIGENKIDKAFFEDVENRKHYYPIVIEIIKVNLSPFFESLFSLFSGVEEKLKSIRKSK